MGGLVKVQLQRGTNAMLAIHWLCEVKLLFVLSSIYLNKLSDKVRRPRLKLGLKLESKSNMNVTFCKLHQAFVLIFWMLPYANSSPCPHFLFVQCCVHKRPVLLCVSFSKITWQWLWSPKKTLSIMREFVWHRLCTTWSLRAILSAWLQDYTCAYSKLSKTSSISVIGNTCSWPRLSWGVGGDQWQHPVTFTQQATSVSNTCQSPLFMTFDFCFFTTFAPAFPL